MAEVKKEQENNVIFALDIGTRSIIGVVGSVEDRRFHVMAIEKQDHGQRAMLDGQIENIELVADVARQVIARLEKKTKIRLSRVCVAAAGRALKAESASFKMDLGGTQLITEEIINQLEAGAVSEAEHTLREQSTLQNDLYYMVGYTVSSSARSASPSRIRAGGLRQMALASRTRERSEDVRSFAYRFSLPAMPTSESAFAILCPSKSLFLRYSN